MKAIRSYLERHPIAVIVLLTGGLLLFGLEFPLLGPDEPRYSQVAREMSARGDLVTPTIGGVMWAEKPVLLYWGMILATRLCGLSEWALRLPSVLAAMLSVGAICAVGRSLRGRRAGILSGIVLATSVGFFGFAHAATTDMLLTTALTLGLGELTIAIARSELTTLRAIRAGVWFGVALLAKGLIGVALPALIIVLYMVITRSWLAGVKPSLVAASVSLAVAGIWYVPVIATHGWRFVDTFFISHHFDRYLSNDFTHPGPPWYYTVVVLAASAPFTPFLVMAGARLVAHLRHRRSLFADRALALVVVWAVAPVVFFSVSASKLPGYVLPSMPAFALLVAIEIDRRLTDDESFRAFAIIGACCAATAAVPILGVPFAFELTLSWPVLLALVVPIATVLGFMRFVRARDRTAAFSALVVGHVVSLLLLRSVFLPALLPVTTFASAAKVIDERLAHGERILGFHWYDHAITFYTNARSVYDDHGNVVIFRDVDVLKAYFVRHDRTALIVARRHHADELRAEPTLSARALERWGDIELLRVHALRPVAARRRLNRSR